jgi:hypothetical protein
MLDISLSLTPEPRDASSPDGSLTVAAALIERGYIVSAASDPTVASHACADRLLRTESQVRLQSFFCTSIRTITEATSRRTPHQSPIRIKTWSNPLTDFSSRPWQAHLPQKTVGTTPYPRLTDHRSPGSPLRASNPIVAHGVGVPSDQIISELSRFAGWDSGQSDFMVVNQPLCKLTVPSQPLAFFIRQRPW